MAAVHVLGSINTDLVVQVTQLPRPGETVLGDEFAIFGGGKGANQAIAAARAGATVSMTGCLGQDAFGTARLADLRREGVMVDTVIQLPGVASGVALIGVDAAGQNSIIVAAGANGRITVEMAEQMALAPNTVLLTQLELPVPVVATGLAAARRAGLLTVLNAAPLHPATHELLPAVELLIVNEIEAAELLGEPVTPATGGSVLARLAARGPRQIVVTLGADGVLAWEANRLHRVPALPVTPVDTTGAGDAFVGVLAAALADGQELPIALRRGVVAGGLAVTRRGAQSSLPSRAEIEAALPHLPTA